ncbi:tigger transposable element-derived protein 6-like [Mercenaria mercenaria]|uniref:tigger transposable element-derived protein 6-like n=1 Tax=Mercenaria mercenaria TaxID=6596 RepID=UPI00234F41A9|nr:tigger transposable element-derived protein 6-like [Mercenaria mercenaria]
MSGERGDVKQSTITEWAEKLPTLCADYKPENIFNMDETGLFFRDSGRKTYRLKGDDCAGGKRSKERITVALCSSMTGEKVKPLVIGKSRSPRCFGRMDVKTLPVDYYFNKKAWMNSYIYEEFLKSLNRKMKSQNRNILLFVDNAPSHPQVKLSNIKVQFLPANTTSVTQPMDQGIIQTVKLKFKKRQLQHMVRGMEQHPAMQGSELLKQITILDAIYWLSNSWSEVETNTIVKCFSKAGFNIDNFACSSIADFDVSEEDCDEDDDVPLAVMQMSLELFGCNFKDLVKIDEEVLTCETQNTNWDAPIENLLSEFMPDKCSFSESLDEGDDSDENENDLSVHIPTYSETCDFVNKLKTFAVNVGNSILMDSIVKFDDELCKVIVNKPKQSQITDFFEKRTL